MVGDEGAVSYSVKELIARLDVKMDIAISGMAAKADQSTVDRLTTRVDLLTQRTIDLEKDSVKSLAVAETSRSFAKNNRYYIFGAVPTTIATIIALWQFFPHK